MADDKLLIALWHFAVTTYLAEGVQAECLSVQERFGVDVNLLLFAAYAGHEGLTLRAEDIASASGSVDAWHADVVRSLRHSRQTLKGWAAGEDEVALQAGALREQVKKSELKAEQIELFMLWNWLQGQKSARARGERETAIAGNLREVLARYGAADDPESIVPRLMSAARENRQ